VGFVGMGASNSSGKLLNPHVAEKSIHEFTVKVSEARYIHTYIDCRNDEDQQWKTNS
jgi:hypothetical protein